MSNVDFAKIVHDAGIPSTQAELETAWRAEMAAQNSVIANDNNYSPFWRIVTALISKPALWLVQYLIDTVLPNAFVKTATGVFLDLLADAVNLTRKPASKAKGKITFTRSNVNADYTVPAGTIVQTAPINGVTYQMLTDADTAFVGTNATVEVAATAKDAGAAYNLASGYFSILKNPIAGISAVTNAADWLTVPGADVENDHDLRDRVRNQFGTAADFHTDSVYRSLIASFPGVAIDAIWFEHDAPRGPGTANAFVLFDFNAPVTDYLAAINAYITDAGHHGHGDDLQVYQMPEHTQDVTLTVWHDINLDTAVVDALQAAIDDFIRAAFRENSAYAPTMTYPFSRFSFARLGKEIMEQFSGIHSLDFTETDIVSELWIPRIDTLTVTMQETE